MKNFNAIGVVEINFFTNALIVLDEMLKSSDVHLVACEKKLGGRMVTIIVAGDTSSVNAAVETAIASGESVGEKNIKVAVSISNPHSEIRKLLNLITQDTPKTEEIKREETKEIAVTEDVKVLEETEIEQNTENIQIEKPKPRRKKQ